MKACGCVTDRDGDRCAVRLDKKTGGVILAVDGPGGMLEFDPIKARRLAALIEQKAMEILNNEQT